jgi:hypothetical protein
MLLIAYGITWCHKLEDYSPNFVPSCIPQILLRWKWFHSKWIISWLKLCSWRALPAHALWQVQEMKTVIVYTIKLEFAFPSLSWVLFGVIMGDRLYFIYPWLKGIALYLFQVHQMFQQRMKKNSVIVGTWTSWSHWSPCTRSCGGGVAMQTRECQNQEQKWVFSIATALKIKFSHEYILFTFLHIHCYLRFCRDFVYSCWS